LEATQLLLHLDHVLDRLFHKGNYGSVVGPEESEAGPFPPLRDYFRAVLAVKGALCRAEKRLALDRSGPL